MTSVSRGTMVAIDRINNVYVCQRLALRIQQITLLHGPYRPGGSVSIFLSEMTRESRISSDGLGSWGNIRLALKLEEPKLHLNLRVKQPIWEWWMEA